MTSTEEWNTAIRRLGLSNMMRSARWAEILSFCLCMLNDKNSGFILNSVHSSEGCYSYTKEINKGECELALGEEEKKALDMAIRF